MAYRVEWKKSTRKDMRRLPSATVDRVIKTVEALAGNPFPQGVEKLSGSDHAFRIRLGDSRLFTKWLKPQSWLKSSASGIGRMSIVFNCPPVTD
ncbi:MAG: hypothetical protein KIS67_28665 [Verrucomicrobiae bacterium]|nr:hypothetical protein [Verrucomicrobiae bacterium]